MQVAVKTNLRIPLYAREFVPITIIVSIKHGGFKSETESAKSTCFFHDKAPPDWPLNSV